MHKKYNKYKVNRWDLVFEQDTDRDAEWKLRTAIRKRQRRSQSLRYNFYKCLFFITTTITIALYALYLVYSLIFHGLVMNSLSSTDLETYLSLFTILPTIIITLPYIVVTVIYIEDSEINEILFARIRTLIEMYLIDKTVVKCREITKEYIEIIENKLDDQKGIYIHQLKIAGRYCLVRMVFLTNYYTKTSAYFRLGKKLQVKAINKINYGMQESYGALIVGYRGNLPIYVKEAFSLIDKLSRELKKTGEDDESVH